MRYFLSLFLFLSSLVTFGVPARRITKTIKLNDGSTKEVVLKGDEFAHYLQANDGSMYRGNESEGYQLLSPIEVSRQHESRIKQRNAVRETRRSRSFLGAKVNTIGKKKGLVILVNFSDRKMSISANEFHDFFNKEGYSNYGMGGSVHDYFHDCSYGKFNLTFDVVGPVTVSKSINYYGRNDSNGDDLHVGELIGEAVELADSESINFKDYDWDGDGEVDQVYVIYAGYGESSGAPSTTIWPHEYDLTSCQYYGDGKGPIKIDGVTVNTYACSNELYGTRGTTIDGIGTACHEFSHCLGIPDMYDTEGSNFGMDMWDLMDYGCYGDDGYSPIGYTSYERWTSGWLTPIELNEPCDIKDMPSLSSSPTAYIIYNEGHRDEYYLLENRQQEGWHKYDMGHGLLILHVDYDESAWYNNTVNNVANHQRMTIIPADNKLSTKTVSDYEGDTWPGVKNNTMLTNMSKPAAKTFHENKGGFYYMNRPLTNISENTLLHTVSFTFDGGTTDGIGDLREEVAKTEPYSSGIYNLQGQPLVNIGSAGVYIVNGKKVTKQ